MQQEFTRPIEQARERQAMMQDHARQRDDQAQRHEREQPQLVASRKHSIEQAQQRTVEQRHEVKQERDESLSRSFRMA